MATHKIGQFAGVMDSQVEELVYRMDHHNHAAGDGSARVGHGELSCLTADDHPQYLLLAGRTPEQLAVGPLKIGATSDNSEFEADGTLKFNGDATVWNDINLSVGSLRSGATAPNRWTITGTNLEISSFDGSGPAQSAHGSLELLHGYLEGSDIVPHLHWCATTTGSGNIKMQLEYAWVDIGGTITSSTTISFTAAASGVVGKEEKTAFPTISGVGKHMGSRFVFRLFRDSADAADTYGAGIGAFDFGIHYQIDTVGSRQITAK